MDGTFASILDGAPLKQGKDPTDLRLILREMEEKVKLRINLMFKINQCPKICNHVHLGCFGLLLDKSLTRIRRITMRQLASTSPVGFAAGKKIPDTRKHRSVATRNSRHHTTFQRC